MPKKRPYVPDITCPYIDETISLINTIADEEDSEWRDELAKLAIAHLEYVRSANTKLRESGKYWYERSKKK